jgi:DNA-binding NarL/FixJ family response regulator
MSSAGDLHALHHSPHALDHSVGGVLIVESHSSVREGLVRFLESNGLRVVGATGDGAEAIRLVGELRPDVVTTEINLPILDGLGMTRAIREQFPGVRVIILTVYDDEVFRNEAKAAGAAAYVVKKDAESVEMLPTLIQNIGHR